MTDLAEATVIPAPPGAPGSPLPPPVFAPPSGAPAAPAAPPNGRTPPLPPPPFAAPAAPAVAPAHPAAPTVPPAHPSAAPTVPPAHPAAAPAAPAPAGDAGPPSIPANLPAYRPPIAPVVPTVAASAPPVPHRAATAPLPDLTALTSTATVRRSRKRGAGVGKFFFVMILLGGIGAAGYVYGPGLLEEWRARNGGEAAEQTGSAEPEAPLAFPNPTAPAIEIRNATFVLDGVEQDGGSRRYEITTDFETRVSRVLIDRAELPTLEVMTFLDAAVVRRVDEDTWYQTARGQFPLDDQLERNRWVRHLDELIPAVNRPAAEIQASTTATVGGERMRHLVVSIDPTLLAGPALSAGSITGPDAAVLQGDGVAVDVSEALVDPEQAADPAIDAVEPPPPAEPDPAPDAAPATPVEPVSIEIWIDSRGIVRQLIAPEVLGGGTLSVIAISADAWIPEFPAEEQIEPLTASALVKLGL